MSGLLARLRRDLGATGLVAAAILLAGAAFLVLVLRPLEARNASLARTIENASRPDAAFRLVRNDAPAARLAAFYAYFDREQVATDWLASLYTAASAAGLEYRQGDYQLTETRQRLDRYRVALPVSGSYAQVRAFVDGALASIPVLSLEQLTFKRRTANDVRVEAEVVLVLHLPRR